MRNKVEFSNKMPALGLSLGPAFRTLYRNIYSIEIDEQVLGHKDSKIRPAAPKSGRR